MTSIANQNKKNLQKKRRFNLEIQNGGLTIENLFVIILFESMTVCILSKAVCQIHCSFLMLPLQSNDSGKHNMTKSCTE